MFPKPFSACFSPGELISLLRFLLGGCLLGCSEETAGTLHLTLSPLLCSTGPVSLAQLRGEKVELIFNFLSSPLKCARQGTTDRDLLVKTKQSLK